MIKALSPSERVALLQDLPLWRFDEERNALFRHIEFSDFAEAISAMVCIGIHADKADHHPEWTNVYNRLDIWLTTHDADGVSMRDIALARKIDGIVLI